MSYKVKQVSNTSGKLVRVYAANTNNKENQNLGTCICREYKHQEKLKSWFLTFANV